MADKLREYQGFYGQLHQMKDKGKEKVENWRESHPEGINRCVKNVFKIDRYSREPQRECPLDEYSHVYRRKTAPELVRISAMIMGIEFSYAAETAFVSPTLLELGVRHQHMTLVWGLSPLLGFFLTPLIGSISDGCRSSLGRRRPFIILLSIGILSGLILVPNGRKFGNLVGDMTTSTNFVNYSVSYSTEDSFIDYDNNTQPIEESHFHPWGVFFTVLGTVILDFNADASQSSARAYLLDVTVPDDHARGLSTFTILAGLGGFFGYALGGINWDVTSLGQYLGGHVRAVFTFIFIIFFLCALCTVTAFKEIPLDVLLQNKKKHLEKLALGGKLAQQQTSKIREYSYGSTKDSIDLGIIPKDVQGETVQGADNFSPESKDLDFHEESPTLKEYLLSIIYMPKSLRILCLTNLFCWMSHVCYSLYFTDFVGESVFKGDPLAPEQSKEYKLYEEGLRFGCWGMSVYSLSCSCYSMVIERFIKRFRARKVYIGGLLLNSCGMMLLAFFRSRAAVIFFSWTAGIMYSTLFTVPYVLVAHYHASGIFEITKDGEVKVEALQRGLGTDVAILSSMVFLAQFILTLGIGEVVSLFGSTTAIVGIASFLAFCGSVSATRVTYLNL